MVVIICVNMYFAQLELFSKVYQKYTTSIVIFNNRTAVDIEKILPKEEGK